MTCFPESLPGLLPDTQIMGGAAAACMAAHIWAAMGERERGIMLWDVAPSRRPAVLSQALRTATTVGIAWDKGNISGIGWIVPLTPGARCGMLHFCYMPDARHRAEALGQCFVHHQETTRHYDSLLAFLPLAFRHARNFARQMGFVPLGVVPGACRLVREGQARITAGELLLCTLKGAEHD